MLSLPPLTAPTPPTETPGGRPAAAEDAALRKAANALEADFLAQMLKDAGFGKPRDSFGGGAGEEQFTSFLVRAQAEDLVRSGGIGLAESIYHALKEHADARKTV